VKVTVSAYDNTTRGGCDGTRSWTNVPFIESATSQAAIAMVKPPRVSHPFPGAGISCAVPLYGTSNMYIPASSGTPCDTVLTSGSSCNVRCRDGYTGNTGTTQYTCTNGVVTRTPTLVCTLRMLAADAKRSNFCDQAQRLMVYDVP
jgi:hypothetical protein